MYTGKNVVVIRLDDIKMHESGIPVGILTDDDGVEVGYLTPFRGYSFQVSNTFNGQGSAGTTPVFGLNRLLDARLGTDKSVGYQSNLGNGSTKAFLMKTAALYAISDFVQKRTKMAAAHARNEDDEEGAYYVFMDDTKVTHFMGDGRITNSCMPTSLDRFVLLSIRWLNQAAYLEASCEERESPAEEIAWHEEQAKTPGISEDDKYYHQCRIKFIEWDTGRLSNYNPQKKEVV